MPDYGGGPIADEAHLALYLRLADMVTQVESRAFYMGYHLVLGFGAGNCRSLFCGDKKRCNAMIRGHECIQPYKSRPSLKPWALMPLQWRKRHNLNFPKIKPVPRLQVW